MPMFGNQLSFITITSWTFINHHRSLVLYSTVINVNSTYVSYLTSCETMVVPTVPLLWRLNVASRGPRGAGSCILGRVWSKSLMERMGFVVRKATKTAKKLPPNDDDLKQNYKIFDGGGEQHCSWFDSQLGSDRRANGARQRLDHDNQTLQSRIRH